jgi:predicted GNAT family N-acyltransferase
MNNLRYKLVISEAELKEALDVRRKVFIEEQHISQQLDLDGRDEEALHIVVKDGDSVVATARVLLADDDRAKIERMAVLQPYRRKGIGRKIISFLVEWLKGRQVDEVFVHAQYPVRGFYRSVGFEEQPPPFREANIKHVRMRKIL